MLGQPEGPLDSSEFENYKLWLARIREERGTQGVAEATFRLYTENRRLRAQLRRIQGTQMPVTVKQTGIMAESPQSARHAAQKQQGERSRSAIYQYLVAYFKEHDQSPSLREIAAACELSMVPVTRHLKQLEREGKITREPGVERGIQLI